MMPPIKRCESFIIIEDKPKPSPVHPDRRIQEAVQPAMLVMDAQGKHYLICYGEHNESLDKN